ncbi:MAG: DUF2905 domain-containing protein [Bdellovibrionota bacterium]
MNPVAKVLMILGALLIGMGLLWQFGGKVLHLGRLPGDIAIERENFKFYFPVMTSILISLLLSLIAWIFHWIQKR